MSRVAFRVDASAAVGAGHLARCRALAAQLRLSGRSCHFVGSRGARPWSAALRADGHAVDLIDHDARDWLGDAEATLQALGPAGGWLVVDHYGLDARWHQVARSAGWRLLVMDDLANRPLAADAVMDPAPTASAQRYRELAPHGCELLLGPRYCLLRAEFAQWRQQAMAMPRQHGRVHVALGGTDHGPQLALIADFLLQSDSALTLVVVAPKRTDTLEQLVRRHGTRLALRVAPASVAQTMPGCDAALGAPGGMLWERFCLGLPSACFAISANQAQVLAALSAQGWLLDLGAVAQFGPAAVARFRTWLHDRPARDADRARLMDAVDGLGAARLADWLVMHDA